MGAPLFFVLPSTVFVTLCSLPKGRVAWGGYVVLASLLMLAITMAIATANTDYHGNRYLLWWLFLIAGFLAMSTMPRLLRGFVLRDISTGVYILLCAIGVIFLNTLLIFGMT